MIVADIMVMEGRQAFLVAGFVVVFFHQAPLGAVGLAVARGRSFLRRARCEAT